MSIIPLTPEEIGTYYSTYNAPSWENTYKEELEYLKLTILTGNYNGRLNINVEEFKTWVSSTPSAYNILDENDIALFPSCLKELTDYAKIHTDLDFIQTELANKNDSNLDILIHNNRANYGVTRLESIIGKNLLKKLLKHLNMKLDDFIDTYGECLLKNPDCLDELLAELLLTGELLGEKRGHKLEVEL